MKRKVNRGETPTDLVHAYEGEVRFSEVDSMHIVWHGNYVKYFEDGREAFGRKFGLDYMSVYDKGFLVPIVHMSCDFKMPLRYGDQMIVETRFINTEAAKIIYEFKIFHAETKGLLAEGRSIQVFVNEQHELMITAPEFFLEWKRKVGLLKD